MARKMKDSGIEWIGEIPEGWELRKGKSLYRVTTGKLDANAENPDGDYPFFTCSMTPKRINSYSFDCEALLVAGNGLVGFTQYYKGKFDAYQRTYVLSDFRNVLPSFLRYYVSVGLPMEVQPKSIGSVIQFIKLGDLLNFNITLPSIEQQTIISNYLEFKIIQIDAILSKTRSSIEEYKKLKQAVITQAVTKGVRGEREMKDSGVEWIGEIPKEWRKTQLRHCATIKSGITLGKSYSKDTVLIERPYLRVANVQGGYVDLNDLATIEVTPDEDLKYRLHSGDVLMTEGGDRDKLGRGCVWHDEIEPCLHQNHVFAVQTNETILLPEFLEYLTASDVGRSYFDVTAIKTTNLACTSSSKVLAFTIPLPPIEEQIEIVSFIKKRSLELNKLIMKKELLVQELESYKKSLIYEVVTGKREV